MFINKYMVASQLYPLLVQLDCYHYKCNTCILLSSWFNWLDLQYN